MNTETNLYFRKSFQYVLERELRKRCKSNPNYSLRSFAKSLEIDPSVLSKLIRGKRKMTNSQIENLGKKLGLKIKDIESFKENKKVEKEDHDFYQLRLDQLDIISDWQHYAILEMMNLNDFTPDIHWVAKQLNINTDEAQSYVDCLIRVGLLVITECGNWVDTSSGQSTHVLDKNYTSYAHRESQKNILYKAIESLEKVDITKRDQSSVMMSSSPEKVEEAKEMIKSFRRFLMEFLEDTDDKSAVYQMSISLFPLVNTNDN